MITKTFSTAELRVVFAGFKIGPMRHRYIKQTVELEYNLH